MLLRSAALAAASGVRRPAVRQARIAAATVRRHRLSTATATAAATATAPKVAAAATAAPLQPSIAQRALGWLFTGGAVAAACGLANHIFDNPVFCQLAVELAQRDPRVAAAAGGSVSAQWWGYAWEGTTFHNRAAITIPLDVGGAPSGTKWCVC